MSKKVIKVSLGSQSLSAYDGDTLFLRCQCLTGSAGHETHVGTFTIFRKAHPYRSVKYDAQMNYALFFTADGQAIHQYHGPGGVPIPLSVVRTFRTGLGMDSVGSHGCVRLSEEDARKLYNWVPAPGKAKVSVIVSAS